MNAARARERIRTVARVVRDTAETMSDADWSQADLNELASDIGLALERVCDALDAIADLESEK